MNRTIDIGLTLGEIVNRRPSAASILERAGLDYCCNGHRTLATAALAADLDPDAIAAEIERGAAPDAATDWTGLSPAQLVDHIETTHHRYLWGALPRITALADKIATVHGGRHPELAEVAHLATVLRDELEPHLAREEDELFPAVRDLDVTEHDGRLLDRLSAEHETVGDILARLRDLTDGYTTPADGCASYTACFAALAELEADTHLHVHKENNILLPALWARALRATTVGIGA